MKNVRILSAASTDLLHPAMEKYYEVLKDCPLFEGIEKGELISLLDCLSVQRRTVSRGDAVFREGDPAEYVGIVLSGRIQIIRHDYSGKRSILGDAGPSELFAEVFACAGISSMPVSAISARDSEILLADFRRIINICGSACSFHNRLIQRLLRIVAEKNLMLNQKIEIISKRTIRERLMFLSFLSGGKKQKPGVCHTL